MKSLLSLLTDIYAWPHRMSDVAIISKCLSDKQLTILKPKADFWLLLVFILNFFYS